MFSNCVIRTVPSGNRAMISSSPPSASMYVRRELTYMSARRSSLETRACSEPRVFAKASCVSLRAWRGAWSGSSASSVSARSWARLRRSGDMRARRSGNFLPIDQALSVQASQMSVVQDVGGRHERGVPAVISRLVAPDEQDGHAPRVEGVEDAVRSPGMLDPQLSHVAVPRGYDGRAVWIRQVGATLLEQFDVCRH